MTPYLKKKIEKGFILQSGLGWGVVGLVYFNHRAMKPQR